MDFRIRTAWSLGWTLIGRRAIVHAVLLIGLGIVLPLIPQFAVAGGPVGGAGPASLGQAGQAFGATGDAILGALVALSWLLQTISYFASWRIGLAGAPVGGALLYGLAASLVAFLFAALVLTPAALAAFQAGSAEAPVLGFLILLIPMLMVFALFYTLLTTLAAAGISLMLIVAMMVGTATGNVGLAATLVGGSGAVAVLLLVISAITIWLAARLSCTTALMAERRSLNLIGAMRESWRLTWDEQWAITRYLALIGFAIALLLVAGMVAIGAGASAAAQQGAEAVSRTGALVLGAVSAVPIAFLGVMVPAGIYRELTGGDVSAEVFA